MITVVNLDKITMNEQGYLVDEHGKKVVFYVCDPAKNKTCNKSMCRYSAEGEDEGCFGLCATTPDPACRKEGTKAFYKKHNEDGYFSREYIEGV